MTLIIYLASFLFSGINLFLSAINFVIPDQISDSITWFFGYGYIFQGVFPVDTLYMAIGTIATVWGLLYGLNMFLHLLENIPFLGFKFRFSGHGEHEKEQAIAMHRNFKIRK